MGSDTVTTNRAPVLTLWAAVVSERMGFERDEALTLGKAVAGLNAQSKGRRLGIFKPGKESGKKARERTRGEEFRVEVLGRQVPAVNTSGGVRALAKGEPIEPSAVEGYLERKFGERLEDVRKAMTQLARAFKPDELAERAYSLYETFRPDIPSGKSGWGAKGELDLDEIRSMAK